MRMLGPDEIAARVRVAGVLGGTFTPHRARVHPGRLVRALARACARRGVPIHERSPAREVAGGRVTCERGTVRAEVVVRATESHTARLPGRRRTFLPMYGHMVATEPLPETVWERIGWSGCEPVADQHHTFAYAQRTVDGRIAIGGRCAPYRAADQVRPAIHGRLERQRRSRFPDTAGTTVTHRWGGPFAVPRDWSMDIGFDRGGGLAWAGGLSGHGVVASNICGRTLADLIRGEGSALTTLPWVGHTSPRWEPEPACILGHPRDRGGSGRRRSPRGRAAAAGAAGRARRALDARPLSRRRGPRPLRRRVGRP